MSTTQVPSVSSVSRRPGHLVVAILIPLVIGFAEHCGNPAERLCQTYKRRRRHVPAIGQRLKQLGKLFYWHQVQAAVRHQQAEAAAAWSAPGLPEIPELLSHCQLRKFMIAICKPANGGGACTLNQRCHGQLARQVKARPVPHLDLAV